MTSPFNECPNCGSPEVSLEGTYCWACGYDAEIESDLIDQIEFDPESEFDGGDAEDEHAGRDGRYDCWKG